MGDLKEGFLRYRFGGLIFGGAYTWKGLFSEFYGSYTLPSCHVTGYPAPVVTWRKSSGPLPQGRVKYYNSALQILYVPKDDSDLYFCSASNLLGRVEKKTLLVVALLLDSLLNHLLKFSQEWTAL